MMGFSVDLNYCQLDIFETDCQKAPKSGKDCKVYQTTGPIQTWMIITSIEQTEVKLFSLSVVVLRQDVQILHFAGVCTAKHA
jgi:hypothetical protein